MEERKGMRVIPIDILQGRGNTVTEKQLMYSYYNKENDARVTSMISVILLETPYIEKTLPGTRRWNPS